MCHFRFIYSWFEKRIILCVYFVGQANSEVIVYDINTAAKLVSYQAHGYSGLNCPVVLEQHLLAFPDMNNGITMVDVRSNEKTMLVQKTNLFVSDLAFLSKDNFAW